MSDAPDSYSVVHIVDEPEEAQVKIRDLPGLMFFGYNLPLVGAG